MNINGTISGGANSTLADITFVNGKISSTNQNGLTIENNINIPGSINVNADSPEIIIKSTNTSDVLLVLK